MLAVHRSLVSYESALLAGLGHEVCTLYDLIDQSLTEKPDNPHVVKPGDFLPVMHPCRQKPISLDEGARTALKLINLNLSKESVCSLGSDARATKAVLDNFDAVYVQMVPAWLLAYGVPMLKAGKKVVLRVFGHPLHELGCSYTPISELTSLSKDQNLTLSPVLKCEDYMWSWWKGRIVPIMAAVWRDPTVPSLSKSGFLSVIGDVDLCNAFRRVADSFRVSYRNTSYSYGFVTDLEMSKAFESSEFFIECYASETHIKYSSLEAISYGAISILGSSSGGAREMEIDGINPRGFCWDTSDPNSAFRVGISLNKEQVRKEQANWLYKTQSEAERQWKSILGG